MKLVAFIDGSSFGNPGESGCGIVLKTEEGKILSLLGRYIGYATNNIAEYCGLLECLELTRQYGGRYLTVFSDSQLLVNQMNGIYRVKDTMLKKLYTKALNVVMHEHINLKIYYISREKNKEADGLARRAIRIQADIIESMKNPSE